MTATQTTKPELWGDLLVTDADGDLWGTLAEIVSNAPANLDTATWSDAGIEEWPQMFVHSADEIADWDTPRVPVDWTGFGDAVRAARL